MSDTNRQLQELTAFLEVIREEEPEALARVVRELGPLLDAKKALAFGVRLEDGRISLAFAHVGGDLPGEKVALRFNALLASGRAPFLFNPAKPEINQRNVPIALPPLLRIPTAGVLVKKARRGRPIHLWPNGGLASETERVSTEQFLRAVGICDDFVLRALICDGSTLLAWVGIFQPTAPTEKQREILAALIPPLQKRLKVERLVGKTTFNATALDLVLEKLSAPAFLITAGGAIVRTNSAGRLVARADWRGLEQSLCESLASPGTQSPYDLTRLSWAGVPDHYLAVQRPALREHANRLDEAVRRWSLRKQGAKVLCRLVQGDANKAIAAKLGCAESTIELHVTQILRQAGVDSRAALIAKFWSRL
jgi:DNA-binding CsgD family transcriptional regulator